jgi:hypothetical protein
MFLAAAALYVAFLTWFGRFPATDEIFFKAPGRLWSVTGRFAAPELTGYLKVEPPLEELWAAYTPGYPFLFGLYCKLVGFGWRQCVLYDALIHVTLAGLTYLTLRKLDPSLSRWIALLVGLAVFPLGQAGRPDELGICFALAGLLLLLGAKVGWKALLLSGGLLGLSAFTSLAVALVLGTGVALVLLGQPVPLARRVGLLLAWGTAAAAVFAATIGPLLLLEPAAYRQFVANAQFLDRGFSPNSLLVFWRYGRPVFLLTFACVLIAVLSLAFARRHLGQVAAWARLWAGPLSGVVLVLVGLSGRYTYLWFVGPWLLCASAIQVARLYQVRRPRLASGLLVLLVAGVLAGSENGVKETLVLLQLPEDQSLAHNTAKVCELIPEGHVVLTSGEYWWALAGRDQILDSYFSRPSNLDDIDFVVLTGNGSGEPGRPASLAPELNDSVQADLQAHFQPVYNHLNRSPLRLAGVRLSNSAYGFGPVVLARVPGRTVPLPAAMKSH